jgi:uncharacterized protein with GYD domain
MLAFMQSSYSLEMETSISLLRPDRFRADEALPVAVEWRLEGEDMPTYMIKSKWTQQGLQNIKQSADRLDAGRKAYEAAGMKMTHFFMTTGPHDMVAIVEAPDDITVAKAVLATNALGSLTTETCRAFTEEEYRQIIGGLA